MSPTFIYNLWMTRSNQTIPPYTGKGGAWGKKILGDSTWADSDPVQAKAFPLSVPLLIPIMCSEFLPFSLFFDKRENSTGTP